MLKLVIGNKNYSSWSMRPWVLMTHFGLDFEEVRIPLFTDNYQEKLAVYSPTLRVPVLIEGDTAIWDSLAISEYLNEQYLDGAALPSGAKQRSLCRAYCAEMHGGFFAIRNQMPMNCRARRRFNLNAELEGEIARIMRLWEQAREENSEAGDYLFGGFSMADAFYAPVVMRFLTYGVPLSSKAEEYATTIAGNDAVCEWVSGAKSETEELPDFEFGEPIDS